jgi:hypothetical protein
MTSETGTPASGGKRIPVLLDATMTVGKLIMIGSTAAVVALSISAHCSPIWVAIRAGITLLATGLLTWAICWIVSRGSLEAARSQMQKAQEPQISPSLLNKRA